MSGRDYKRAQALIVEAMGRMNKRTKAYRLMREALSALALPLTSKRMAAIFKRVYSPSRMKKLTHVMFTPHPLFAQIEKEKP